MRRWGLPAAPVLKFEPVQKARVSEQLARAQVNSLACGAEGSPLVSAGAAPVRGPYRSLEPAVCRRLRPADASVAPGRPPKAWEASRSPAKAPDPERQSALRVALRLLLELRVTGHAPPNIPTRRTARTRAKGRRQSLIAHQWSALPRCRARAPRVPLVSSTSGSSLSKYPRISPHRPPIDSKFTAFGRRLLSRPSNGPRKKRIANG